MFRRLAKVCLVSVCKHYFVWNCGWQGQDKKNRKHIRKISIFCGTGLAESSGVDGGSLGKLERLRSPCTQIPDVFLPTWLSQIKFHALAAQLGTSYLTHAVGVYAAAPNAGETEGRAWVPSGGTLCLDSPVVTLVFTPAGVFVFEMDLLVQSFLFSPHFRCQWKFLRNSVQISSGILQAMAFSPALSPPVKEENVAPEPKLPSGFYALLLESECSSPKHPVSGTLSDAPAPTLQQVVVVISAKARRPLVSLLPQ